MTYRLWYRTYTDFVDIIPDLKAFDTYEEAQQQARDYISWHSQQPEQYVRIIETQHVQCGEMVQYCECEADA